MLNNVISIFGTGAAAAVGDYDSIATVTVGAGGAANVEFTSIPATYKHLQIRFASGDSRTGNIGSPISVNFNSDTNSNYNWHELNGSGSAVASYANVNDTKFWVYSGGNDARGAGVIDILDYANTNKFKTGRTLCGVDADGSGQIWFLSSAWRSTNAITSIKLTPFTANFRQYSHFALYGVKG